MKIILYKTPSCSKCTILANKLKELNIEFTESFDIDKILEKGFMSVPVLEINGKFLEFKSALTWIKNK